MRRRILWKLLLPLFVTNIILTLSLGFFAYNISMKSATGSEELMNRMKDEVKKFIIE